MYETKDQGQTISTVNASATRLNIASIVSKLAQYNDTYQLAAVKRVLRYWQGIKDYDLVYKPNNKGMYNLWDLDADYANDLNDRIFYTDYVYLLSLWNFVLFYFITKFTIIS